MRRNIRLTGRRQLAQSAFSVHLADIGGKRVATLSLRSPDELKAYPPEAEIRLKLVENKLVEVLRFGTVAKQRLTADVTEPSLRAPSCQVRIVTRSGLENGKLLGSTSPWTLRTGGDPDGILLFQPADIKPLLWKLSIPANEGEQPILYVDERIPDAGIWVKSDPLFLACVFPQVVTELMRKTLSNPHQPDEGWEADWLTWADSLMPGSKPPLNGDESDKEDWISSLVTSFCQQHELADKALEKLTKLGEIS